ncbi:hypothetical protein ABZ837_26070 [Streptomyces sp. NPDC047197]|uniref:hypothetical protein n=1 Tax=Streptomyces sp. NPDC047197 TaxID=3155477 RepID=UPI00340C99EB
MTSRGRQSVISDRLGLQVDAGAWCSIDKIPQPPSDVLQAAGAPRLRPGRKPALDMLGAALCLPFVPFGLLFVLLANMGQAIERSLAPKSVKERLRAKREDEQRRDALVTEQGLDRVFDGNWQGNAGQFLLRWYSHSPHDMRLVLVSQGDIVLAAPPRRVSGSREKLMEIVARLPAAEAALVDPFFGEFETKMLLLRFRDGSWLRIETEDARSDLHMYLLRQPRTAG